MGIAATAGPWDMPRRRGTGWAWRGPGCAARGDRKLSVHLPEVRVQRVAQDEDFETQVLMHAMGANTAGQLGSVAAGGALLALADGAAGWADNGRQS